MPDLSRIQNSSCVQVTDDNSQVAVLSNGPAGTEIGLVVRNIPFGTQSVSGTITATPTGTYTVAGTITASPTGTYTVVQGTATNLKAQVIGAGVAGTADAGVVTIQGIASMTAVKVDGSAVTQPVSGTITATPTGTYTVAGTVTAVPTGTYTVAGGVTSTPTGTYTVATASSVNLSVDINGVAVTTSTISTVTVSTSTSTSLLSSNSNRNMATFFNEGSNLIWLKWGTSASATSYSVQIPPNGYYEMPVPVYAGAIEALAQTSTVVVRITEM